MPLSRRWAVRSRSRNRWLGPLLLWLPGFVVVHHVGRRSQQSYQTPLRVTPGIDGDVAYVALTYGLRTDWFLNLQANRGLVESGRRRRTAACRTIGEVNAVAVDRVRLSSRWQMLQLAVMSRFGIEYMAELRFVSAVERRCS